MTDQPARYRCAEEAHAMQWTGTNADQLRAFCGSDFDTIDPEDRGEDPDETAAVRSHTHGGWIGLADGDWVVKHADHFSAASDAEFRGRWSPVPAASPAASPVAVPPTGPDAEIRRARYAAVIRKAGDGAYGNGPFYEAIAEAVIAVAETEQAGLRRERDLAIAHDRQPYPTAWAYEQACTALHAQRARAEAAEARLASVRADVLRDAVEICDEAGAVYTSQALNEHAAGAYALMERLQRKAEEAEEVAPVPPPPADRAAALTEAERTMLAYALDQAQEHIWSRDGFTDEDQAAVTSLRRLAAEAPAPEPRPAHRDDPIECSHEAALGQARETNRRLNLRAQRLESELATYRRAVASWQVSERGTYITHASLRAIGKAAGVDLLGSVRHLKHFERIEQAEAAIKRVLDWAATLDAIAVEVHGPGTRHPVADHIRELLDTTDDAEAPAAVSAGVQPDTEATPCGPAPDACDAEAGEPCANHEREQAHAEGEHCFCGPDCTP